MGNATPAPGTPFGPKCANYVAHFVVFCWSILAKNVRVEGISESHVVLGFLVGVLVESVALLGLVFGKSW